MTKGELRAARKAARAAGKPLDGALALPRDDARDSMVFSNTPRGRDALYRWAKRYDALNGAPDGPDDY